MTLDLIVWGPAGLHDMRSQLGALLRDSDVDPDLADDVVLAACEIATNGFRHGEVDTVHLVSSIGPESVELTLRHRDRSSRPDAAGDEGPAGRVPVGGRGLHIVDQICSWRYVELGPGERSTRVSFARA